MENHDLKEALMQSRFEKFAVEVITTENGELGEVDLKVTHNGYQWQSMTLLPIERLKVIRALLEVQ